MATSRDFVLGMALTFGVAGLAEPHVSDPSQPINEVAFVQNVVLAILVFCWVKTHARENSIEPPPGASILAAFLPPIGVPYYAFRGFGLRRGAKLVGLALLTLVGLFAIYMISFAVSTTIARAA